MRQKTGAPLLIEIVRAADVEIKELSGERIMLDFFREHQLNFMLFLAGVCFTVAICGLFYKASREKKLSLFIMGMSAALLMMADRYAYLYRGNESELGYWMVRVCNFVTFLCPLIITHSFNWYLSDFIKTKTENKTVPLRLKINEIIVTSGVLLLILSQFTGLYYTFDEHNRYQRADGYIVSAFIPLVVWLIAVTVIIKYRKSFSMLMLRTLFVFASVPIIASFVQIFFYGISITNLAIASLTVALRLIEIVNTNIELTAAHERERELLIQESRNMHSMLTQTASALASAIDAKDKYTHGHSRRVGKYSEMIAKKYGKSDRECREIYIAGLLHDVGKIGIPNTIINKDGKLTDEEFAVIKTHPSIGADILKKIGKAPFISIGAHYHHERYDGKGYPEGLSGEDIPEIARIIAVADAYDAMTSKRSYRDSLPQQVVREEIVKGRGTQFDPQFAEIMLQLIDNDKDYTLRQLDDDIYS